MSVEVLQIVKDAAYGHNLYVAGASIRDADVELIVGAINTVLDDWNAARQAIYVDRFSTFVTVPALQPHTIGPSGVWVLAQRPVSIERAAWLDSTGAVVGHLVVHADPDWWDAQAPYPSAGGTDAYYAPEMPNGKLYFVGVPSGAIRIRLLTRSEFTAVAVTDSLELPQGYRSALTLTVMEAIAEPFGKQVSATLSARAGIARGRVFANNLHVPSLSAQGLGLPGTRGPRFDARTGQWY